MFILTRPTAERSNRSGSKNRPWNSAVAASIVGGSPGTHHPVDVHQRFLLIGILVDVERVADERADIDVVNVEDVEFLDLLSLQLGQQFSVELVAGFGEDLTRLEIDDVFRDEATGEIFRRDQDFLDAALRDLARAPRRDFLALTRDHFAGFGIGDIRLRCDAAELVGEVRHLPAALRFLDRDVLVEVRKDLLVVEAQRIKHRRHRQLAAPVDAHIDVVLGVEFEIEPRTAIGNDAGSEQQLAR